MWQLSREKRSFKKTFIKTLTFVLVPSATPTSPLPSSRWKETTPPLAQIVSSAAFVKRMSLFTFAVVDVCSLVMLSTLVRGVFKCGSRYLVKACLSLYTKNFNNLLFLWWCTKWKLVPTHTNHKRKEWAKCNFHKKFRVIVLTSYFYFSNRLLLLSRPLQCCFLSLRECTS